MLTGQLLRSVGLCLTLEPVGMHLWNQGPQRQADLADAPGSDASTMTAPLSASKASA
ncbi:hypothetical protein FHX34_107205 [Actinoplanes teichomyceticus]|uniref:Uncharacterized protein n=1 Tax=Actinoplanes teichomyceticus TaxID=1867 RepID=A0A561VGH6_ACTTI|nr:hypothetical protein FHX34_107205 [Actinoplanes teichomyceticus]